MKIKKDLTLAKTHAKANEKPSAKLSIIEEAANLFANSGYEGTSINAIAIKAGIKKSLIQYHFPNKRTLWEAAVTHIWSQREEVLPHYLDSTFMRNMNEKDQQNMVRDLCKTLLKFTFDHPQWVKLMFQEASVKGPRLDWMVETFFKDDFKNGQAMIEMAQERGLLPKTNPVDLLHILSGALIYLVNVAPITAKVLNVEPNSDSYIEHHIKTLMSILNSNSTKQS